MVRVSLFTDSAELKSRPDNQRLDMGLLLVCILLAWTWDVADSQCTPSGPPGSMCCGNVLTNASLVPTNASCCGDRVINKDDFLCCMDQFVRLLPCGKPKCCGDDSFNNDAQMCCNTTIKSKPSLNSGCCGALTVDHNSQLCCEDDDVRDKPTMTSQCCAAAAVFLVYDTNTQLCCNEDVIDKPAGFVGATCDEYYVFLTNPTTPNSGDPDDNSTSGGSASGGRCKWEVPFWIVFAALLTLLALLALTALYRCCWHGGKFCRTVSDDADYYDDDDERRRQNRKKRFSYSNENAENSSKLSTPKSTASVKAIYPALRDVQTGESVVAGGTPGPVYNRRTHNPEATQETHRGYDRNEDQSDAGYKDPLSRFQYSFLD